MHRHSTNEDYLKKNHLGDLQLCECGGAYITLGPVSLHFTIQEIDLLHELVTVAKHTIQSHSDAVEISSDPTLTVVKRRTKRRTTPVLH
jgi:hypothetical protein